MVGKWYRWSGGYFYVIGIIGLDYIEAIFNADYRLIFYESVNAESEKVYLGQTNSEYRELKDVPEDLLQYVLDPLFELEVRRYFQG